MTTPTLRRKCCVLLGYSKINVVTAVRNALWTPLLKIIILVAMLGDLFPASFFNKFLVRSLVLEIARDIFSKDQGVISLREAAVFLFNDPRLGSWRLFICRWCSRESKTGIGPKHLIFYIKQICGVKHVNYFFCLS